MKGPDPETLRVDQWLHHVRLAPTREQAKKLCEGGKVDRNGERVKPSTRVRHGDRIAVSSRFGPRVFEVLGCPAHRVGAPAVADYYRDITPEETRRTRESLRHASLGVRDRGAGRPTKRDRRAIEQWLGQHGFTVARADTPSGDPERTSPDSPSN